MGQPAFKEEVLTADLSVELLHREISFLSDRCKYQQELIDFSMKAWFEQVQDLEERIAELTQQLFLLKKEKYGSSSVPVQDSDDYQKQKNEQKQKNGTRDSDSENPQEELTDPKESVFIPAEELNPGHIPPKSQKLSEDLQKQLEDLPQVDIVYDLPEKICGVCGSELIWIGRNLIRNQIGYVSGYMRYNHIYQNVYKCPNCTGRYVGEEYRASKTKSSSSAAGKKGRTKGEETKKARKQGNNNNINKPGFGNDQDPVCTSEPSTLGSSQIIMPAAEEEIQNSSASISKTEEKDRKLKDSVGSESSFEGKEKGLSKKRMVPEPGSHIIKSPVPRSAVGHSRLASEEILVQILLMKFVYCMPYNTLAEYWSARGFDLSVAKMSTWVIHAALHLFLPLLEFWKEEYLLKQSHNQYDETFFPVYNELDEEGKKKPKKGNSFYWGAVSAEYESPKVCCLTYRDNRRMENPAQLFSGFNGALIIDKYAGYNILIKDWELPYARCWNHWYRKAKDCLTEHNIAKSHPAAVELYNRTGEIIAADKEICRLPFEERLEARQRIQAPLVYSLFEWCENQLRPENAAKLPKSVKAAISYGFDDPEGFFYFLTDANMPLSNLLMLYRGNDNADKTEIGLFLKPDPHVLSALNFL